ncbi:hypothetical protein Cni_G08628 [Canna indica]|uniref:Uncharacterized protein n=1 Tax=Canna indica TaxID=4628 RepID=A0AAQ3K0T2_9LILI|nr:hypothetical protein Cni_G08628 [Canna indica]
MEGDILVNEVEKGRSNGIAAGETGKHKDIHSSSWNATPPAPHTSDLRNDCIATSREFRRTGRRQQIFQDTSTTNFKIPQQP